MHNEEGKIFDEIKNFHHELVHKPYTIRKGSRYYDADERGFEIYKMQIPKQLRSCYHGGICWDLCMFQSFWFKRYAPTIPAEFYYHEIMFDEETSPSHTFMIFQFQDQWYWFEASWKPKAGIYRFHTKDVCLGYVVHMLESEDIKEYKKKPIKRWFTSYEPLTPTYQSMSMLEFMEEMRNHSQLKIPRYQGAKPVMESVNGKKKPNQIGFEILNEPENVIEKISFVKDVHGMNNALVNLRGYSGYFRGRSEVLVIRGNSVFLGFNKNGGYDLPGGGWEPNEDHAISAIREAQEEIRVNIGNPLYICTYISMYDAPKEWVKKAVPKKYQWCHYYTNLYVGEYLSPYNGHIDERDKDQLLTIGKFYPITKVFSKLKPHHQNAIVAYVKNNHPAF